MKRGKFIAGITALSIMMMGSGYAMWSQGFTATNTVTAGNLHITTVADQISPIPNATATVNVNGGNVVVAIGNAYPGATTTYSFTVTNDGSIPVKATVGDPTLVGSNDPNHRITVTKTSSNGSEIAVGGTETYTYTVTFSSGANADELENQVVQLTNSITYNQFNVQ